MSSNLLNDKTDLDMTGERFIPELCDGEIVLEHLHRYMLARDIAKGKKVLDIASGEGYGSAVLSQVADSVIGVDISAEAISHAQSKYATENLTFQVGSCSAIPLADASVDLVVSFETIEHHTEHEAMMREIKRVLRPRGVLIISSPDKLEYSDKPGFKNEYHVKELYRGEFESLLKASFDNYHIYGQRVAYGSVVLCEEGSGPIASYQFANNTPSITHGLTYPVYLLAVASDAELPLLRSGIFDNTIEDASLVKDLRGHSERLESAVRILQETVTQLENDRDARKLGVEQLQMVLEQVKSEMTSEISRQSLIANDLNTRVVDKEVTIAECHKTIEYLAANCDAQKITIMDRDTALADKEVTIAECNKTIESLAADCDAQKVTIMDRNIALTKKEAEIVAVNKILRDLLTSHSWRLTAPLRWLSAMLSKVLTKDTKPLSLLESKHDDSISLNDQRLDKNELAKLVSLDVHANEKKRYRILLVSHYAPTRAHAGGLRILDLYSLIREQYPSAQLDILTHHRPNIDWSIDDLYRIFDNVYLSPVEDLTPDILSGIQREKGQTYDLVDLQFHQAGRYLDVFRKIGSKVIFTPMESQAKVLFTCITEMLKSGKRCGLSKIASLIQAAAEEIVISRKSDEVVCVSSTDAKFLRMVSQSHHIRSIDTGISKFEFADALEPNFTPIPIEKKKKIIIYVAYFGSETNVTALNWFLESVHPLIQQKIPDYVLKVVGRGDLSSFMRFQGVNVELIGEVPSLATYICDARVGIAPALGGSGFRGKVNQYAILGVPTVTSSIAFKGLAYRNEESILVADVPTDFAECCIRLLSDNDLNDRIALAARNVCLEHYSWLSKWPEIRQIYGVLGEQNG